MNGMKHSKPIRLKCGDLCHDAIEGDVIITSDVCNCGGNRRSYAISNQNRMHYHYIILQTHKEQTFVHQSVYHMDIARIADGA